MSVQRSDEMPDELAASIPHDPRLYVRNMWNHPEDPNRSYDFYDGSGEDYFWYLVDEQGPLNPAEWGDIVVLLFARGCLKTTTCTMIANWGVDCYPNLEVLVTAPRRDQTQEVMGRVQEAVEMSGLKQRADTDKQTHQRFRNEFLDDDGNQQVSYSEIKSRSSWGEGDALRGIHAHVGIVDEFQDVDEGMFSVFLETVDRDIPQVDYFPTIFVIGTPKLAGSFFDRLWQMSDQREWDDDAKEWRKTTEPKEYMPEAAKEKRRDLEYKIEALQADDGDHSDKIASFQSQIDDLGGFEVTGWHIDQYASPRHSPEEIAFKKAEYPERKFKNEVEARFYSPENDLLTKEMVMEVFDRDRGFHNRPMEEDNMTVMGVDWGGGSGEGAAETVIVIGEVVNDTLGSIDILNIDILDPDLDADEEIDTIEDYLFKYNVDIAVVDEGYGDTQRSNLQKGVGTRTPDGWDNVYGCHYGHVNKKDGVTWARSGHKDYFTVNRTFMIEEMVADVKRGRITIPAKKLDFDSRSSVGTKILDQMSAPYTDRVETPDGKKKLRVVSDRNDDIFHAFTYMWIAANMVENRRQVHRVGAYDMY